MATVSKKDSFAIAALITKRKRFEFHRSELTKAINEFFKAGTPVLVQLNSRQRYLSKAKCIGASHDGLVSVRLTETKKQKVARVSLQNICTVPLEA
jgi:hypothetical protein